MTMMVFLYVCVFVKPLLCVRTSFCLCVAVLPRLMLQK